MGMPLQETHVRAQTPCPSLALCLPKNCLRTKMAISCSVTSFVTNRESRNENTSVNLSTLLLQPCSTRCWNRCLSFNTLWCNLNKFEKFNPSSPKRSINLLIALFGKHKTQQPEGLKILSSAHCVGFDSWEQNTNKRGWCSLTRNDCHPSKKIHVHLRAILRFQDVVVQRPQGKQVSQQRTFVSRPCICRKAGRTGWSGTNDSESVSQQCTLESKASSGQKVGISPNRNKSLAVEIKPPTL